MNNENEMPIMNDTSIKLPVMEKASYVPIGIITSIMWHSDHNGIIPERTHAMSSDGNSIISILRTGLITIMLWHVIHDSFRIFMWFNVHKIFKYLTEVDAAIVS